MSNNVESAIKPFIGDREIAGQNPRIDKYLQWYKGYDPEFHDYTVYVGTGNKSQRKKRKHLPTGKIICETWANLLLNEKTDVKMKDADKKILDKIFKNNRFWKKGNKLVEKTFALSIGAFVVDVEDLVLTEQGTISSTAKSKIRIDCINATKIYPITVENGDITECAFATSNTNDSFISLHLKNEKGNYEIQTLYFKDKDFKTFDEERSETFDTKSPTKWFHIIYPNIVDNQDVDSSLGASILENHIDQMKAIDMKYDVFHQEFKQGKKRTYVSAKLEKYDAEGNLINTFDNVEDDVFVVPQGDDGKNLIQVDNGDIRSSQCIEGLNSELSMLGYSVGFGKGFLTFNADAAGRPLQTATAVMMQNTDLFRSVHKHEIVLEEALVGLIETIIEIANEYTTDKFSNNAKDDIEILFDDSIFEDKEAEKNSARTDLQNGIMSAVEYRVKFYGETEKEAQTKLKANPAYIATQINAFLPALQAKAISPKEFVKAIWFEENAELEKSITEGLESNEITQDDMMAAGFGAKA